MIACVQAHGEHDSVHEVNLSDPRGEARNTILLGAEGKCKPLFCRHCEKPGCAASCMSGAMAKDPASGHVRYDRDKCGQCYMCVMNCPFGVLKPDRATGTYVVKCDFCQQRGSDPSCVKMCPTKAIFVEEV